MSKENFNGLSVREVLSRSISTKILKFVFGLTLLLFYCVNVYALNSTQKQLVISNNPSEIVETFGYKHTIYSSVLMENRDLYIYLPQNYNVSSHQFPVIYVLDGEQHYKTTVQAVARLVASDKMPEAIIVGIPNNTGQRMRDAYDHTAPFIRFITQEVVDYFGNNFKTSSKLNVLFGHSAMGMVTLETMMKVTGMFQYFMVSSPAIDQSNVDNVKKALTQYLSSNHKATSIYLSVSHKDREGKGFVQGAEIVSALIDKHLDSISAFKFEQYNAHNHTSVAYISFYNGLNYLFDDYQAPALNNYKEYQQYGGIEALKAFFVKRGEKYHNDTRVPVHTLASLGYAFMQEDKFNYAIELLKSNLANYNDSSVLYGALAFIQEQNQQKDKALSAYEMALKHFNNTKEIAATQKYYSAQIKALKLKLKNSPE